VRAVHVTEPIGPRGIRIVDVLEPTVDGAVVIDVHAAGVGWPDLLLSKGEYQVNPELPFVPGTELAGVIRSVPPGTGFFPGQRVAAVTAVGAWQEVFAAPPDSVVPLPEELSLVDAAALLTNYLTVHFALTRRGNVQAGETVLVHGASGGVGEAGLRIAKAMGARAVGVVSTPAKAEYLKKLDLGETVLADGFLEAVRRLTGGRGVDVVLDPVGGDRFVDSLRALAPEGRLLVVGFAGGSIPNVRVNRLLLNNLSVAGVGWGAMLSQSPVLLRDHWQDLTALLSEGTLTLPTITSFGLADAATVLLAMERREILGKAVLRTGHG